MYQKINHRSDLNIKQDNMLATRRWVMERKPETTFFYELEEAVVLDIVLDADHPEVKTSELNPTDWPPNSDGSEPKVGDKNYGLIGRIKFRFLHSEVGKDKRTLNWAMPRENTGVSEYPLLNEVVVVGKYMGKYFYSRKLNTKQVINTNASFATERMGGLVSENLNEYDIDKDGNMKPYTYPRSKLTIAGGDNYEGVLGKYFMFNHHIRALKRYEGDTVLESRFGSSIRFGAYDENRSNDVGVGGEYGNGGGNPMILIRNRQAPIKGTDGFTAKGYTVEDINKDGSSIALTSGRTLSAFIPTVEMAMYSGLDAVPIPSLKGDQIIINSDRLVFSSKINEMLFFSKKRVGITTDEVFTVSAKKAITISTNQTFSVNATQIFLGKHNTKDQPAVLGRHATMWLSSLCDLLLANVESQIMVLEQLLLHQHTTKVGPTVQPLLPPNVITIWTAQLTSLQAQKLSLLALQLQTSTLLSSQVFLTPGDD